MSRDEITDDARPDGVSELTHRKLPCIKAVVSADDTAHSILSDSRKLLRKICAFSTEDCWKNSIAAFPNSLGTTSP